jgi:error-prone DNA polymerase
MSEHVVHDYSAMSLSLKAHPVSFVRRQLFNLNVLSTKELSDWPDGTLVKVAGLVLVRQRPGTAAGICFITIEDETGSANLVVLEKLFEKYRKEILQSKLLMVEGKLQIEDKVIHVIVQRCYNLTGLLSNLGQVENDPPLEIRYSKADEKDGDDFATKDKRVKKPKIIQAEMFPSGRNFR